MLYSRERLAGVVEFQRVQQFGHPLARGGFAKSVHAAHKQQELVRAQRLEKPQRLGHYAHAPLDLRPFRTETLAEDLNFTGRGIEQPREAADRGALARPVRAEEAEHGAGRHREGKAVHRQHAIVFLHQVLDSDRVRLRFHGLGLSFHYSQQLLAPGRERRGRGA